ncbi:hypothetical protein [Anabaenopsis elenkinii]|uniref:Uncharacterized protein n=1 Tax=Anabaenopsis elenkinii CCIBt3563 TaxID=2779889 RepID=A0A7U3NMN1_9CYAN|nr:hypothetical protein [Anabaenopsis elenkinii]QOV21643.1 hypothetical protein IM676_12965 [Anabaenopsis elenkinii CCIBt3563]
MEKRFLSFTQFSLLSIAGISLASLFLAPPSLAQFNSVDRGTNQNSDPLATPNSGDLNMFDIIHRANLGNLNWNAYEQKQQIDSAASDFRARQQKAFQEQQRSNTDSPSVSPEGTQLP